MSNVVIIGAGQTGRGYLNRFFQSESITFLDKDEELIHSLQIEPCYHVSFGPGERRPLALENYNAYLIDSEDGIQAMADADLIMVSVGKKNLKDVAVSLKKGLAVRTKDDIDILTAENGVNVKQDLMELCEDQRVHLAEAIVFCTTIGEKWSLDILSQNLDYLPYDVVALGHTLPYENMVAEEKLDVLMQRKIYTYNCISAVVSYLGYYKKYEVYSDAANDTEIVSCIEGILKTLNHCICEEYQIPHELILTDTGHSYEESSLILKDLLETIDSKYQGKTKGIFLPNDTFANIMLNHLIQKYGQLPDDYKIIGFDDSPVSREAIVPISTVGQQIDKIAASAMEILHEQITERHKRKPALSSEPVHKIIPPILINRKTTEPSH